jgi:hypothetical protein
MRQFMMTVTTLALFGAMVVTAQAETPSPGTKELLVRYIHSMQMGQPNDDEMTSRIANINRSQMSWSGPLMKSLGALKSISFRTVNARGWNIYDATFRKGRVEFSIAPLTSDGKVSDLAWHISQPPQTLSAASPTCSGLKSVCLSGRECSSNTTTRGGGRLFCGGKFCDWEWEQCMKSGWWQGSLISRSVERR